jgi:hypothetical protein
MVLKELIAGYDDLVGQDFTQQLGCAKGKNTNCSLEIGQDSHRLIARISRPLHSSRQVFKEQAYVLRSDPRAIIDLMEGGLNRNAYIRGLHAVHTGKHV